MTEQGDLSGPSQAGQAQSDVERSLLSDLLERSRLYHTSEDYLDLLGFVSRLRNFAPFNAMLLQIQRPGLTYAASEYDVKANVTVGSFDFYLLTKAAGKVETALGIAAHTLFEPKDERNAPPALDADPQDHRNP